MRYCYSKNWTLGPFPIAFLSRNSINQAHFRLIYCQFTEKCVPRCVAGSDQGNDDDNQKYFFNSNFSIIVLFFFFFYRTRKNLIDK